MPIAPNIVANPQQYVRFFSGIRLRKCGQVDGTLFPFSENNTRKGCNCATGLRIRDNHNYNNYIIMFVLCGAKLPSLFTYLSIYYDHIARNLRNEKRVFYDFLGTIARNLRRNSEKFTEIPEKRVFYDFLLVFCPKSSVFGSVLAFFAKKSGHAKNRKASFLRFFLTQSEFFTIFHSAYAERI